MSLIFAILNFLFGWALKAWQQRGPSPIVVESEKAGAATADLQTSQQSVATETAIAQAEASAPKTQAGVVNSLDNGSF